MGLLLRGLRAEQQAPPGLRHPAGLQAGHSPASSEPPSSPEPPARTGLHRGAAPSPPGAGYLRVGNGGAAITLKDEMTFLG